MIKPNLYDLCIQITSKFEGTNYGTVTGNFDGQGISAGLLQWNLGSGTLQAYILNHLNLMSYDFPYPISKITSMKPDEAVSWAKDVMLEPDGKLKPEWDEAWVRLMTNQYVINTQKRAIDRYFHRAKELAGRFGYEQNNRNVMPFFFDLAVQNWSADIQNPEPDVDHAINCMSLYSKDNFNLWCKETITLERAHLISIAHFRALKAKPEWRNSVFDRKATCAMNIGIVNKTLWNFKKLF
jgi:hypothetical protein